MGLQSIGARHHGTAFVLTFSQPMDAAGAQDPANYRLVWAGPDHRLGTRDDRVIRIRRARYDPGSQSVTLRLMHGQPLHRIVWLTVAGAASGGLTGTAGTPLAGIGSGRRERRPPRPQVPREADGDRPAPRWRIRDAQGAGAGSGPDAARRAIGALGPWRITAGSVNVQTYWPATEGMQTLDLNGVSPGTIEQSFATVPGQIYQLLFDFANNPDDRALTADRHGERHRRRHAAEPGDLSCGLDAEGHEIHAVPRDVHRRFGDDDTAIRLDHAGGLWDHPGRGVGDSGLRSGGYTRSDPDRDRPSRPGGSGRRVEVRREVRAARSHANSSAWPDLIWRRWPSWPFRRLRA